MPSGSSHLYGMARSRGEDPVRSTAVWRWQTATYSRYTAAVRALSGYLVDQSARGEHVLHHRRAVTPGGAHPGLQTSDDCTIASPRDTCSIQAPKLNHVRAAAVLLSGLRVRRTLHFESGVEEATLVRKEGTSEGCSRSSGP